MITLSILSTTVILFFSAGALAQNSTAGDIRVGWVSSGSGRSTSDILWSCFSILLVCTWKCVHFNVPSIEESEAGWLSWPSYKPGLGNSEEREARPPRWSIPYWPSKLLWRKWAKKVGWLIAIVIAPELGVAMGMDQFLRAREPRELEAELGEVEALEPSVATVMDQDLSAREPQEEDIANISKPAVEPVAKPAQENKPKEGWEKWNEVKGREITKTHAFFANMGGFSVKILFLSPSQQDKVHTESILLHLKGWKGLDCILNAFPNLELPAEEDLQDLSKADAFTKAFACVQSSWLIIQCIARVSVGLPITQLELATIAFVVCALIMYILWWNKPFGVERRTTITAIINEDSAKAKNTLAKSFAKRLAITGQPRVRLLGESLEESFRRVIFEEGRFISYVDYDVKEAMTVQNRIDYVPDLTFDKFLQIALGGLGVTTIYKLMEVGKAFGNLVAKLFGKSSSVYPPRYTTTAVTFYAAGTLFSAFHIGAWNWEFPSSTVQTIWRSFAVAATSTGPFAIFYVFVVHSTRVILDIPDLFHWVIMSALLLVYVLSRLGLIVIIFYCFSSMPAGVYETVDWTKYLPYFS